MEPQRLTSIHGWQWIKQGYALFVRAPLLWIVLLLAWLTVIVILSAVPVVGDPLTSLLMPSSLVGFMVGCRALEQGEELELAHLLSGFRQHTAQLVTLGGIALVGQFLIFGVMATTGGADFVSTMMAGQEKDPVILAQIITDAGFSILLGLALLSVLMMAMQFAPMLVYFENIAPVAALKLSFRAFLANIGPMMVYGTTLLLLAILASIPAMLGWLLLFPVMLASLYVCYREIFPTPKETPSSAAEDINRPGEGTF